MSGCSKSAVFIVRSQDLPENFPTHRHSGEFWEALGRTIGTFGFLEDVLAKAIFSFTATQEIPEEDLHVEFEKWIPQLKRALSDPLGRLIGAYDRAVRENTDSTIENLDDLIEDLRAASKIRNVLCHGSWRSPDEKGRSMPHFVSNNAEVFSEPIDVDYLNKVRQHVSGLCCAVINSVTHMGWQFPGSDGPGTPIFQSFDG